MQRVKSKMSCIGKNYNGLIKKSIQTKLVEKDFIEEMEL